MKRRLTLALCALALLGYAAHIQNVGRAKTPRAAAIATNEPDGAGPRQSVTPPALRGPALVAITDYPGEKPSPLLPRRTAGQHHDASSTGAVNERADAPARSAALTLARACYLEASFSFADCRAITSVLRIRARRARVDTATMALRYTALDADNDRARFARELPAGDLEEWNRATNRLWSQLRQLAARSLAGHAPTPCAGATHWGGLAIERDARRAARAVREGRWRRVQCSEPTANAFYAEVSAPTLSAAVAAGAVPR